MGDFKIQQLWNPNFIQCQAEVLYALGGLKNGSNVVAFDSLCLRDAYPNQTEVS
jgi:hypothetical protein